MKNTTYFLLTVLPSTILGLLEGYFIFTKLFNMFDINYYTTTSGFPIIGAIIVCLALTVLSTYITFLFFDTMCTCIDKDKKEELKKQINERKRVDEILGLNGISKRDE